PRPRGHGARPRAERAIGAPLPVPTCPGALRHVPGRQEGGTDDAGRAAPVTATATASSPPASADAAGAARALDDPHPFIPGARRRPANRPASGLGLAGIGGGAAG